MINRFFSTIQSVKDYVGAGANISLQMASLAPYARNAAKNHLSPYLGKGFMDWVNGAAPLTDLLSDAAKDFILRPIAMLTMYEWSQISGVHASELGMMRVQTDSHHPTFRYQETKYENYMLANGYECMDELLEYLMAHRTEYTWWRDSNGYKLHTALFVRYAWQLRMHYGMNISRYTYEILRPVLRDVEYFVIEVFLPIAFVDHLRALNETGEPTPQEKDVLEMIQAACVHLAIAEALRRESVQFLGRSVVQLEKDNTQSNTNEKTASKDGLQMKLEHHEISGNRHLKRLESYIRRNQTAFPLVFTGAEAWQTEVQRVESQIVTQDKKVKTIMLL